MGDSTIYSGLDLKSGFLNIPCTERASELLGLVTQDGLFRFLRMPFGCTMAPMFFQYCMEDLLSKYPDLSTLPFFDDLTPHGKVIWDVWHDTIRTFCILCEEGIMINIKKCKLLVPRMDLLGFIVFNASWHLGQKTLSKYLDLTIPRTLK